MVSYSPASARVLVCVVLLFACFYLAPTAGSIAVFGHKSPDTDAIAAAIAYTWELNARNLSATAYRLGDLNPETEYVLKTLKVQLPPLLPPLLPGQRVAIVDTNNPAELPSDIGVASIHSIVDHHKLSGLTNVEPLEVDIRPMCSTGSILFARAKARGLLPPQPVAALMLSSILSDSLGFRSPTTTSTDKEYASELAILAGLEADAHADAMLAAKAQIGHLTPHQLLMLDSKVFQLGRQNIRVSVLELTKPAPALQQREALVAASQLVVSSGDVDELLLFVIDILKEEAVFIATSAEAGRLVERAWGVKLGPQRTVTLPGVLSRKKQIIPALSRAIEDDSTDL